LKVTAQYADSDILVNYSTFLKNTFHRYFQNNNEAVVGKIWVKNFLVHWGMQEVEL